MRERAGLHPAMMESDFTKVTGMAIAAASITIIAGIVSVIATPTVIATITTAAETTIKIMAEAEITNHRTNARK